MNYYTDVLKKYAVFSGRARRKEYWLFALWNFIIVLVFDALMFVFGMMGNSGTILTQLVSVVGCLYVLAIILPSLGVFVRRLHDTGRTGWWILIGLIPVIGGIVLLIFSVMDSQPGDNKYGPNPKGVTGPQVAAGGAN
jgi:uncharacterized membrane protein YhaH (DUF805 family)